MKMYTDYMIKNRQIMGIRDFILLEEWQIWYLEKEH